MKSLFKVFALSCTAAVVLGCSGDDNSNPAGAGQAAPQAVAQIQLDGSGGGAVQAASMNVAFKVGVAQPDEKTVFDFALANADEGTTRTVNSSNNPDFADAVTILTNGVDNQAQYSRMFPGGGGGSSSSTESFWIKGGVTGNYAPDFTGVEITHFLVHLDRVDLDVPGSDPNNNGNWTDYRFNIRLVVMGRP